MSNNVFIHYYYRYVLTTREQQPGGPYLFICSFFFTTGLHWLVENSKTVYRFGELVHNLLHFTISHNKISLLSLYTIANSDLFTKNKQDTKYILLKGDVYKRQAFRNPFIALSTVAALA